MSGLEAFVSLATKDSYCKGAISLGRSLRDVCTQKGLALLITNNISAEMRNRLSMLWDELVVIEELDSRDVENLALLSRPELGVTFTKIHAWRLTHYSKCVFLDSDTLVLQNVDELFEREELSAAPDIGWPDCFNSGVFVFKPSLETFRNLMDLASQSGSFDGGDQGLLNTYWGDWATKDIKYHLPFIYNMVANAHYGYAPAFQRFGKGAKIVHFIGPVKPWQHQYLSAKDTVILSPGTYSSQIAAQELIRKWWQVYCSTEQQYKEQVAALAKEFGIDPHDLLAQQQALITAEQAREKKVREERQKAMIEQGQRIGERREHHTSATIHLPPVCQPSPEHEIMQDYTRLKTERAELEKELQDLRSNCANLEWQLSKERESVSQLELQHQHQFQLQLQQREEARQQQLHQLQQRLENAAAGNHQLQQRLRSASAELQGLQDIEPWKVSRNKVKLRSEISSGGWGSISEGTLRVAIKQLHRQILSPHNIDRLQREMQMLAQVRHPNLVQFIGVVLDEPALKLQEPPMIITELLDVNLRKAYERKLGFNKLSVFREVAQALKYLHERHDPIIHRDVSAPNVLLEALPNSMWKAKLSDLGSANLAKLAHTLAEGAIIYAAPETLPQLAHQSHDPHSPPPPQTTKIDVYSYGILLCEVVTSRFPDPDQYPDMLGQVQHEWSFMYDLILSCTQSNPDKRPTMAEVLTKLPQPRC